MRSAGVFPRTRRCARAAGICALATAAAALEVPAAFSDHGAVRGASGGFAVVGSIGGAILVSGAGSGSPPGMPPGADPPYGTTPGGGIVTHRSVQQPPAIEDGLTVVTDEDVAIEFAVSAIDLNSGADLDVTFSSPGHGRVIALGGGRARYVPAADYRGPDSVPVGTLEPSSGLESSGAVAITVRSVNDPPVCTAAPGIAGQAAGKTLPGATLTADAGTWNDDRDGGASTITTTIAWQRTRADGSWEDLGVVGADYAPAAGDVGRWLRVRVSAVDSGGPESSIASSAPVQVEAALLDDGSGGTRCGSGSLFALLALGMLLTLRRSRM